MGNHFIAFILGFALAIGLFLDIYSKITDENKALKAEAVIRGYGTFIVGAENKVDFKWNEKVIEKPVEKPAEKPVEKPYMPGL